MMLHQFQSMQVTNDPAENSFEALIDALPTHHYLARSELTKLLNEYPDAHTRAQLYQDYQNLLDRTFKGKASAPHPHYYATAGGPPQANRL